MKDKVLLLVIGILVGAVISTGAFFVYTKATTCNTNGNTQIVVPGGNPPSMPGGQNGENGQPPEKPSDSNTQDSNQKNNN